MQRMRTLAPVRSSVATAHEADWESPAGRDDGSCACARAFSMSAVFIGAGDPHWIGQPCAALEPGCAGDDTPLVVFACGCRARVPRKDLVFVAASRRAPPQHRPARA